LNFVYITLIDKSYFFFFFYSVKKVFYSLSKQDIKNMTWEVVKIIGNLFNDTRNKKPSSNHTTNNTTISASNNHRKSPSLNSNSQKIPSSPIIHPIPILRTPSTSSTIRTTASSNFPPANDDAITQQLAEESELLYLQLPEDVKSILDKLRVLQRSEKSFIFDQQLPNGEWQVILKFSRKLPLDHVTL